MKIHALNRYLIVPAMCLFTVLATTQARAAEEYFSPDTVKLTEQEKAAIGLAQSWQNSAQTPIQTGNGKVAFVYGTSIPRIVASPLNITDIELEEGEIVQAVLFGDSARWLVESGVVGATPHLFVKPLDAGLETSAVVTTSARAYHFKFVSKRTSYMPYIGFVYPRSGMYSMKANPDDVQYASEIARQNVEGRMVNLQDLDFGFSIKGRAKWKPVQVYSYKNKTYVKLPERPELPILLARSGSKDVIVNYRIENRTYMVDGVYDEVILLLGVGAKQEKINIRRVK